MAIIQHRSQGMEQLLQTLISKNQLEAEKERIKLQRQDFELRQETAAADRELEKAQQQGALAAVKFLMMQQPELRTAAQDVPDAGLPSFLGGVQNFQLGQEQVTNARLDNVKTGSDTRVATGTERARTDQINAEAGVAVATAPGRIAATNADNRVAVETADTRIRQSNATLADTTLRNAINSQVLRGDDPVNGARALSQWASTGLTWGEVKEAVGFTGKTDIPDDKVFIAAGSASGNQDMARAQSFLPGMRQSHERIQQLGRGDFDGDGQAEGPPIRMGLLSSIQQAAGSGLMDIFINEMQDKEQQALVQANRTYADLYRFSLSGQQSSDQERLAMMLSVTETVGDDPSTIAQKSRLRQLMIDVTAQRAAGTINAVAGARQLMTASLSLGDASITAAYSSLLNTVIDEQDGVQVSGVPGDNTLNDVTSIIDDELRR